jgi:transcriptional regulator with XRE-family HTH domain
MLKPSPNLALKTAIAATGEYQKQIAKKARIDPQRLSDAVRGRRSLREREIASLERVLGKTATEMGLEMTP